MHEVLNEIPFFEGDNSDEFLDLFLTQNELTFKIKNFKAGSSPGIDSIDYDIIIRRLIMCRCVLLHIGFLESAKTPK